MSRASRRGRDFEAEVHHGLQRALGEAAVYKIPDAHTMGMLTVLKSPADFIVSVGAQIFTIEAKQTKIVKGLPLANIREHQIDWATRNPTCAYFVVNFNNRQKTKAAKINRTFLFNGAALQMMIIESHGENSIRLALFEEYAQELPRITGEEPIIDFKGTIFSRDVQTSTLGKKCSRIAPQSLESGNFAEASR
jgi:penicillin-binding protein-related factor A (putative recombinase)